MSFHIFMGFPWSTMSFFFPFMSKGLARICISTTHTCLYVDIHTNRSIILHKHTVYIELYIYVQAVGIWDFKLFRHLRLCPPRPPVSPYYPCCSGDPTALEKTLGAAWRASKAKGSPCPSSEWDVGYVQIRCGHGGAEVFQTLDMPGILEIFRMLLAWYIILAASVNIHTYIVSLRQFPLSLTSQICFLHQLTHPATHLLMSYPFGVKFWHLGCPLHPHQWPRCRRCSSPRDQSRRGSSPLCVCVCRRNGTG